MNLKINIFHHYNTITHANIMNIGIVKITFNRKTAPAKNSKVK
jgi:hypothetical protein